MFVQRVAETILDLLAHRNRSLRVSAVRLYLLYMNKKFLFLVVGLMGTMALIPSLALALDLGGGLLRGAGEEAGYASASQTTFAEILGSVVQVALSFIGVIFITLMVYAGYTWMTARGDESKVEKATEIIRTAIIGLIITTGAYSITAFVLPRILDRTTGVPDTGADNGSGTGNGNGSGSICTWNSGSMTNPPGGEAECFETCASIGRTALGGCRIDGSQSPTRCTWGSGYTTAAAAVSSQAGCDQACASVARAAVNCQYSP